LNVPTAPAKAIKRQLLAETPRSPAFCGNSLRCRHRAGKAEPWFSLWSSLAHQGDVYSASFAAVPHVVHALSTAPERADASFFQFPTWVEIYRQKTRTPESRSRDRD
jgi:hypothetical protein